MWNLNIHKCKDMMYKNIQNNQSRSGIIMLRKLNKTLLNFHSFNFLSQTFDLIEVFITKISMNEFLV